MRLDQERQARLEPRNTKGMHYTPPSSATYVPTPKDKTYREDLDRVIKFLLGEGELEGYWYGDKPLDDRPKFWWRRHLRQSHQAIQEHIEGRENIMRKSCGNALLDGVFGTQGDMVLVKLDKDLAIQLLGEKEYYRIKQLKDKGGQ